MKIQTKIFLAATVSVTALFTGMTAFSVVTRAQQPATTPAATTAAAPAPVPVPAAIAAEQAYAQSRKAQDATPPADGGAAVKPATTAPAPAQQQAVAAEGAPEIAPPTKYYNYAFNDAEYSVMLPEAPTSKTIWSDNLNEIRPFLEDPPSDTAALGETAIFKRVDIDTEDVYDVKITFLRARKEFLETLTENKIKDILKKQQLKDNVVLNHENFSISNSGTPLKWAQLSGFLLDKNHHPAFWAIHYLTGQQSIQVVQVNYSLENKTFQEYYKKMIDSIVYNAP